MLDRFHDFWLDGPGALPLVLVIVLTPPAFILWVNVSWIIGGN